MRKSPQWGQRLSLIVAPKLKPEASSVAATNTTAIDMKNMSVAKSTETGPPEIDLKSYSIVAFCQYLAKIDF